MFMVNVIMLSVANISRQGGLLRKFDHPQLWNQEARRLLFALAGSWLTGACSTVFLMKDTIR